MKEGRGSFKKSRVIFHYFINFFYINIKMDKIVKDLNLGVDYRFNIN
jgi:hypothetical protein